MFNFYVFQQAVLVLLCVLMLAVSVFTVRYHQWWPARIVALILAILSIAAALGLICA